MSRALGISGSTLTTYTVNGIDERTADRLAARAGFVAWALWPELLDDAIAEIEKTCAADGCEVTFVPPANNPRKKWCSHRCKARMQQRKKYTEKPETHRRRVRAYDEANRDTKRRYNRAYYRLNRDQLLAKQRERDALRRAA